MITFSKQDFLKNLYKQKERGNNSTSATMLADILKVSNAAISDMSKKLSVDGLIHYKPYKGLVLTMQGETEALKVLRRHRLWEMFLVETLSMDWAEVHEEAENLEHLSSDSLMDKIDEFLGFPQFDPHGSPIPDKNGVLPEVPEMITMNDAEPGHVYKIIRVNDLDKRIMKYFKKIGLTLYSEILIKERLKFDNSVIVDVNGSDIIMSEKLAASIFLLNTACKSTV